MDVALRGGEHDVEPLASLIQAHTLPEARTLMNGGLCERLFQFAKMELDRRSDPAAPLVELTKQDIVKACDNLPPPPRMTLVAASAGADQQVLRTQPS